MLFPLMWESGADYCAIDALCHRDNFLLYDYRRVTLLHNNSQTHAVNTLSKMTLTVQDDMTHLFTGVLCLGTASLA